MTEAHGDIFRLICAATISSFLIVVPTFLERRHLRRQQNPETDETNAPANQQQQPTPSSSATLQKSHPTAGEHRTAEQSFWKGQTGLGIGALALSALAVVLAGKAYLVSLGQLNEMRGEQRPWVYADVVAAGRIILAQGEYAIPLKFSIKNTGHMPAFSVAVLSQARVLRFGDKIDIRNAACDEQLVRDVVDITARTIFPDEVITQGGISRSDYPRFSKWEWDSLIGDKAVLVYGCVDYRFPADPGHHQSRFAYVVGGASDKGVLERISPMPTDPTATDIRLININPGDVPAN